MATARNGLSITDAGKALGVSRSTVWRMIRRGDLASVRRHGRRLVLEHTLRTGRARTRPGAVPAFTKAHPVFGLVGAGRSGGQPPGARDKHGLADR